MLGEQILEQVCLLTGDLGLTRYDEINDAYESILRRGGMWIARVRDDAVLTFKEDVSRYTLPLAAIRRLESVWVQNNEDEREWRQLLPVSEGRFERQVFLNRDSDGDDEKDTPAFYRLHGGDAEQLEVTPTPDGTYAGRAHYIGHPQAIGRLTTPILPESYHRTIAKKAAVSILRQPKATDSPEMLQARLTQAGALEREVEQAVFELAFDLHATPDASVAMPRQRIMRS